MTALLALHLILYTASGQQITHRGDYIKEIPDQGDITTMGDWSPRVFCPEDSFAFSYSLKVEDQIGNGDDSGANAFRLLCGGGLGWITADNDGPRGTWRQDDCPIYFKKDGGITYITGFNARIQQQQGGGNDDFGMTGFNAYCTDGSENIIDPIPDKGDWNVDPYQCDPGDVVCGFRQRVVARGGGGFDDKGLTEVKLACCRPGSNFGNAVGRWEVVRYGNVDQQADYTMIRGISLSMESTWSTTKETSLQQSLEASLGFEYSGVSGEIKYGLTTSATSTVFRQTLQSQTNQFGIEVTVRCPNDGNIYLGIYQFVTDVDESSETAFEPIDIPNTFTIGTNFWFCSLSGLPPKCPPYYCDMYDDCQSCINDPFGIE